MSSEPHPDTLATAIRAAAEGAATGTAATIAALGELKGAVLTRLSDGDRRMGEIHDAITRLDTRLEERTERITGSLQGMGRDIASHESRIKALERSQSRLAQWALALGGWVVAIATQLWQGFHPLVPR